MTYILSLDEGTTSARTIIFDHEANIVSMAQFEFPQLYPKPGWVEHRPEDIWEAQFRALKEALFRAKISSKDIEAIGITNQRETTLLWDRRTGVPVFNAIVWQDRRTAPIVDWLRENYHDLIRSKTGLIPDSYFSAVKIKWLLDNVPGLRERAEKGDVVFGTVNTFLIWKLTGGKIHVTDYSNASRTMLFDIRKLDWCDEILEILKIPGSILPEPRPSSEVYGYTDPKLLGCEIPISGDAGDQQAALFGQACFNEGMVKCTYGTGNFILMNTGYTPRLSKRGLLTTIAWGIDKRVCYAIEGSIFITGAAVQWLRDGLGFFKKSSDIEELARQVPDTGGVYVVPAFVGLGAPYWDQYARGLIIGITRGTTRAHIARAVLEAIAYQTRDVILIMEQEGGIKMPELRVDGGAARNNFLMQFQADILNRRVLRPRILETTALGAAFLAGLAVGYWISLKELSMLWKAERVFEPIMDEDTRRKLYEGWKAAVRRALGWAREVPWFY